MRMHLYLREFAFVYTQKCKRSFLRAYACVRLRACLRADLIKTQNAFVHKIFQHSNALWVQKLSGCTIPSMVLTEYAKRIVLFEVEAKGYRPPTIAKMLKSEGIFVSRRGVAKFYREYK